MIATTTQAQATATATDIDASPQRRSLACLADCKVTGDIQYEPEKKIAHLQLISQSIGSTSSACLKEKSGLVPLSQTSPSPSCQCATRLAIIWPRAGTP
jgi:hypothetical protein